MKKMFIRLGLTAFMMTMVMIPGNMSKAATIDTDEMQTIPYVLSEKTDGMAEV